MSEKTKEQKRRELAQALLKELLENSPDSVTNPLKQTEEVANIMAQAIIEELEK